ncbi:MAG: class I SAM-dependent methyltransferase, partial [Chloroflexota bacterium]
LYERLEQGGAVLIADLVAPTGERERRYMADRWDAEVKGQSAQFTSSLDAYQRFVDDRHNWFEYPDPVDMPSCIPDHLSWLQNAGFGEIDVFWATAGHAVYGGYKK